MLDRLKQELDVIQNKINETSPRWNALKNEITNAKNNGDRALAKNLADELESLANTRAVLKSQLYNVMAELNGKTGEVIA